MHHNHAKYAHRYKIISVCLFACMFVLWRTFDFVRGTPAGKNVDVHYQGALHKNKHIDARLFLEPQHG